MASPNPVVEERNYYLNLLGIADDPTLSLADLKERTGGAARVDIAANLNKRAYALMSQFDPRRYGTVDISGSTDSSPAIIAAIADWQKTGGELSWPAGIIRIDSQIVLSYDTDPQPKQKSGTWKGRGATFNGTSTSTSAGATPPNGGTILDLRYAGAGSKIDTRGLGLLEIFGITFTDQGTSSTPFIHTTNTTLQIHNCAFIGNPAKYQTTCDQDAIILGGTNTGPVLDNTFQSPFQGYGTVIKENYFARIRRGVLVQTYGNSVVIHDNTWWANCGSNLAGGAAIEVAPTGTNYCVGLSITDNLIECLGYIYGITADYLTNSWLAANHFWDYQANMIAAYRMGDHATFNTIIAGQYDDSKPLVDETIASYGSNTQINGHQSMATIFSQLVRFTNQGAPPIAINGGGSSVWGASTSGDLATLAVTPNVYPYPEVQINASSRVQVTDLVTTNGSAIVTSATAGWALSDVGMPIAGPGIPGNTVIKSRQSATQVTLSQNATVSAVGVTATFGKGIPPAPTTHIGFDRRHIISKGAIGAAGPYAAAGAGATCTAQGTDTAFTITLTTGTAPTAGQLSYTGFQNNFGAEPKVVLVPKNAAAASAMSSAGIYATNTNANFFLNAVNAPPASTQMIFDVVAIQ